MPENRREIVLVTPVWKDASRLAVFGMDLAAALERCELPLHWVISDDGSNQKEQDRLEQLRDQLTPVFPRITLRLAPEHLGKGAAVRNAWNEAPEAKWLAFVDADGSLAPDGLIKLIETARECDCSVLAIRQRTETTELDETPFRAFAHRAFLFAARLLTGLRCQDPQCGAKVLKGKDYRDVAPPLREHGLAFDTELLVALQEGGHEWKELPVTWREKPGGQVRPLRDAWGMLAALMRTRRRMKAGEFRALDRPVPPA